MKFHCTHPLANPSRKQSEQKGSECLFHNLRSAKDHFIFSRSFFLLFKNINLKINHAVNLSVLNRRK
ncbi:Uncharacterised protein [Vibrio cholerae]|uniref:Uncharacterized protein n=1 Tax=Vibrio cholerae TaxID=666 RepID=A0A655Z1V2_VIBCL|nr:hypothetical protein DN30_3088 [Vibrio cholerae]OEC26727.1 hypothetical protein BFX10_00640 [Vibrio cholerae]OFI97882.1 hypothetical protein BFX21_00640 [Vibrio cholerae]CSC55860.1 Uncharacterised protein [Vibrio cholerae]